MSEVSSVPEQFLSHLKGLYEIVKISSFRESAPPDLADWPSARQEAQVEKLRGTVKRELAAGLDRVRSSLKEMMSADSGLHDPSGPQSPARYPMNRLAQFSEQRPIFVVGATRSGTTALGNALRSAPRMFGWLEGHLFPKLLWMLRAALRTWEKVLEADGNKRNDEMAFCHFDVYDMLNRMVRSVNDLYTMNAGKNGAARWIDKTPNPGMIETVPLLRHLYPQAKFLFMHRDPIRRTLSRMSPRLQNQYPLCLERVIFEWVFIMCGWRLMREYLGAGSFREISQPDLSLNTAHVVDELAGFLELSGEQADSVRRFLTTQRPQATGISRDDTQVYLEDVSWTLAIKEWILDFVEPVAQEWGYCLTRS